MDNQCLQTSLLVISTAILLISPSLAADPDPLQDICPADLTSSLMINGFPCRQSPLPGSSDGTFFSSTLIRPGSTVNPDGSNVTLNDVTTFPGLNTLGISMGRVDYAPGGLNPPHVHPRASELGIVVRGELLVGIITTDNVYYSKVLRAGENFVIPRGLAHFEYNVGKEAALHVPAFNSQRPGTFYVSTALFGSTPPIPSKVLSRAFRVDSGVVEFIKAQFEGGGGLMDDLEESTSSRIFA